MKLKTKNRRSRPELAEGSSLKTNHAFSMVEILLAVALFAVFSVGVIGLITQGWQMNRLAAENTIAKSYASEGIEALHSVANQNFTLLSNTDSAGITQTAGVWTISGVNNTYDSSKYTRTLAIADVYRDGSGNVVASGGTLDPTTKKATSTVAWNFGPTRSESSVLSTYLTNWRETIVVPPDWTNSTMAAIFDLTNANSGDNNHDGISVVYDNNKVYLGRANSAGKEFYIFDLTNPDAPALLGSRDLVGTPNDIVIRGNYAYIASTDNNTELQILDVSVPADIALAGKLTTVNLTVANSGNDGADALKLATSGNYLYMIRAAGDEFLTFDLTNPSAPGNPVGRTVTLTGTVYQMAVSGNYIYVATGDDSAELQVIDITTKTAPTRVAALDLNSGNNNADACSIAFSGNYILVGRNANDHAPELYSIDVTTPTSPVLSSTMEVGSDVTDISTDSANKVIFLATNDSHNELKIAQYTALNSLPATFIKSFDLNDTINDTTFASLNNRLFLATSDDAGELQVIKPQ